jgi:hypothetical protein
MDNACTRVRRRYRHQGVDVTIMQDAVAGDRTLFRELKFTCAHGTVVLENWLCNDLIALYSSGAVAFVESSSTAKGAVSLKSPDYLISRIVFCSEVPFAMLFSVVATALALIACTAQAAVDSNETRGDGACFGANANPWVYNFHFGGLPGKIINDASGTFPVESGLYTAPPGLIARALRKRFLSEKEILLDNNVLYLERADGGMLVDVGSGPLDDEGFAAGTHRLARMHAP